MYHSVQALKGRMCYKTDHIHLTFIAIIMNSYRFYHKLDNRLSMAAIACSCFCVVLYLVSNKAISASSSGRRNTCFSTSLPFAVLHIPSSKVTAMDDETVHIHVFNSISITLQAIVCLKHITYFVCENLVSRFQTIKVSISWLRKKPQEALAESLFGISWKLY